MFVAIVESIFQLFYTVEGLFFLEQEVRKETVEILRALQIGDFDFRHSLF